MLKKTTRDPHEVRS